ncbi:hypothetical protein TE07_002196 [Salmonella enterica subsp. enterica]|nr:hypothetical protein [Salmonella enterica subsp. enterica serovar Tanger]EED2887742.1 hypothetical protein [Salmonella enterica subsp. enterica serovar Tanger]
MMSTPFYKVRQLAFVHGWELQIEGESEWQPVAAWANVEIHINGDTTEVILPCVITDGCLEPTDLAIDIREK